MKGQLTSVSVKWKENKSSVREAINIGSYSVSWFFNSSSLALFSSIKCEIMYVTKQYHINWLELHLEQRVRRLALLEAELENMC